MFIGAIVSGSITLPAPCPPRQRRHRRRHRPEEFVRLFIIGFPYSAVFVFYDVVVGTGLQNVLPMK